MNRSRIALLPAVAITLLVLVLLPLTNIEAYPVGIMNVVSTAVFPDRFYIEAADRSAGIGVLGKCSGIGKLLIIQGQMVQIDGERLISANSITETGTAPVPRPLFVRHKDVRLSTWWWVKRPDGKWEYVWQPVTSASSSSSGGLSAAGLLVKTCGWITQIDPSGNYFYIDDGSGLKDDTKTGEAYNIGAHVAFDGRNYTTGQYVAVTGICSSFMGSDGCLRLLFRPREQDIQILSSPIPTAPSRDAVKLP